jgi:hypothetical protein
MATLRQAARVNMQGYQPMQPQRTFTPQVPPSDTTPDRHPNMLASMPLMASTGDAFQRQFYGGSKVPTYRVLPVKKGAGA